MQVRIVAHDVDETGAKSGRRIEQMLVFRDDCMRVDTDDLRVEHSHAGVSHPAERLGEHRRADPHGPFFFGRTDGRRPDTDRVEAGVMGQRHPVWRCGIEHGQVTNADQRHIGLLSVLINAATVPTLRTLPGRRRGRNAHPVQWQEPPPHAGAPAGRSGQRDQEPVRVTPVAH